MCGIALAPKSELIKILNNQKSRGQDSLGLVDFEKNIVAHSIKKSLGWYEVFIKENIDITCHTFAFLHHRKASIGDIHLENSHPFIGTKFILAQNGTSPDFYTTWKDVYHKETDSETILAFLEENCNTLEECITALDDIDCPLGNIFIFHKGRTLIYSDSTRETYVDTSDFEYESEAEGQPGEVISFVNSITNYKENTLLGYRNGFHIIMNSVTGEILHEWMYSDTYNQDVYNTITIHGLKAHKRTQVTKKKEEDFYGSSLEKANGGYNNYKPSSTSIVTTKKNGEKTKAKGTKKITSFGLTSSIDNKDLKNIIDNVTSLNLLDQFENGLGLTIRQLEYIDSTSDIFRQYNDKTKQIFLDSFNIITRDPRDYGYIYEAADVEVFNAKNILARIPIVDICPISFTPYDALYPIEIFKGKTEHRKIIKLNIIRHIKFLELIEVDDVILYFDALKYFLYDLKIFQFDADFAFCKAKPYSLYTYMQFHLNEDIACNPTDIIQTSFIPVEFAHDVRTFVMAGYALQLTSEDLSIHDGFFNNVIRHALNKPAINPLAA